MVDLGREADLGRFEGIVGGERDREEEDAAGVGVSRPEITREAVRGATVFTMPTTLAQTAHGEGEDKRHARVP